jgi:cell division protein FtsW
VAEIVIRVQKLRDPTLFWLAITLSALGLFFIFDAGYARSIQAGRGALSREFLIQIIALIFAIPLSCYIASKGLKRTLAWSKLLWLLSLALLVLVEVPGIGHELNGATRWIKIGPILIQPSEFAKLTLVLYLAGALALRSPWKQPKSIKDWPQWMDRVFVPKFKRLLPALWAVLAIVLIALEPDLGTAAILAVTAFAVSWAGGASKKSLIWFAAVGALAVGFLIFEQPYRLERITNHMHRFEGSNLDEIGFQTGQSELAMAGGGIAGAGIGAGRAKHILPGATTDFMPTTIAEEFGFVGWLLVTGLLAALVMRILWLAGKAPTRFGGLVLFGIGTWLGVQSVTNLCMANGLLPAIGIPLPFLSSGGSSLIALWLALGACQAALAPQPSPKEVKVAPSHNRWRHGRPRLSRA